MCFHHYLSISSCHECVIMMTFNDKPLVSLLNKAFDQFNCIEIHIFKFTIIYYVLMSKRIMIELVDIFFESQSSETPVLAKDTGYFLSLLSQ